MVLLIDSFCCTYSSIPINNIDYWIGSISPRCVVNIIYARNTDEFTFRSSRDVPVTLIPLEHNNTNVTFWDNHKFSRWSFAILNPECYYSLILYKRSTQESKLHDNQATLLLWIRFIAHSVGTEPFDFRFSLLLYYGNEKSSKKLRHELEGFNIPALTIIYLAEDSRNVYKIWCKQNETFSSVFTEQNIRHQITSVLNIKELFRVCSEQAFFGVILDGMVVKDISKIPSDPERKIITNIFRITNYTFVTSFRDDVAYPMIVVNEQYYTRRSYELFDRSIRIFTCHTVPVLSFYFYVSAFDIYCWVLIVLCWILLGLFLHCYLHYSQGNQTKFSPWFYYLGVVIEESYNIPSKILDDKIYQISSCMWLMTGIVLTNIYISNVIAGLNAPLGGTKLETFDSLLPSENAGNITELDELYNLVLVGGLSVRYLKYFESMLKSQVAKINDKQRFHDGYTFLSEPLKMGFPGDDNFQILNPYTYRAAHESLVQIWFCYKLKLPNLECKLPLRIMSPRNKHFPSVPGSELLRNSTNYARSAIEEELVQCKKSIYLESSKQFEFKYMADNYPKKKFYYLKDGFRSTPHLWGFRSMSKSKIPGIFQSFLQSGIYYELHKIQIFKENLRRKAVTVDILERHTKPNLLDMSSSIQTVFILFCVNICLANTVLLAEIWYTNITILSSKPKGTKCNWVGEMFNFCLEIGTANVKILKSTFKLPSVIRNPAQSRSK